MPDAMLSFPDAPRSQLDRTLADLVEQAQDVMATQGRLRALLRANQAVIESLDLADVLRKIVEAAVELVGAQYGALGVVSPSGGLEQFIHVGMPAGQVEAIGHLPEGHGLLGALIDDPRPIRLEHLSDDPRSAGFPAQHPPMESFLGVPVRIRDRVFGNLYLSNQHDGNFSPEDEQLVGYLAATAGFAIENARLFAETKRRQAWAAASAEVTGTMLSTDRDSSLVILLSRLLVLAEADLVYLASVSPDGEHVIVTLAQGLGADELADRPLPLAESLAGRVFEGQQPLLVNDGSGGSERLPDGRGFGPVMGLPMMSADTVEAVLMVSRLEGAHPFDRADLEMAADFAGQGAVALELLKARAAQERMTLLEDRGRIARDLHDHVIQQLFGTGLELQSIASMADPTVSGRLVQSVANLDDAISQIRTAIFALSSPTAANRDTIRHRLIDLANELAAGLGSTPAVAFTGPVDLVIVGSLADDVFAVVREAVTNVTKHAKAVHCTVRVEATADAVVVTISDDGQGMQKTGRRSGVANLEARARIRGGRSDIESDETGTTLTWSAPLSRESE